MKIAELQDQESEFLFRMNSTLRQEQLRACDQQVEILRVSHARGNKEGSAAGEQFVPRRTTTDQV